jgi:hypothetical protein
MAHSWEGKHPPQNIPWYIGKFNMNYIILRHVEIFPKRFFSNLEKKKKTKDLMECWGIYIICQNISLKFNQLFNKHAWK